MDIQKSDDNKSGIGVIGLLIAFLEPFIFFGLPIFMVIIGLILLIISKISLFRRRIWFSFGSRLMTEKYASLYKLSYLFISLGVVMILASAMVNKP